MPLGGGSGSGLGFGGSFFRLWSSRLRGIAAEVRTRTDPAHEAVKVRLLQGLLIGTK